MTNKILKLILRLLFLFSTFTFIFGTITTTAYNNTNYMQDCPIDFPYCYEQSSFNNFDRCYFDCVTNEAEFLFGNAKVDGNYCEYRGLNPSNCTNIPVNPPKTTVDPIDGCNPNLSNSYCYSYNYDFRTYPETSTYSIGFDQQAFFDNSNSYYSSIDSNYYTNVSSFEPYTDSFYSNDYMSYGY